MSHERNNNHQTIPNPSTLSPPTPIIAQWQVLHSVRLSLSNCYLSYALIYPTHIPYGDLGVYMSYIPYPINFNALDALLSCEMSFTSLVYGVIPYITGHKSIQVHSVKDSRSTRIDGLVEWVLVPSTNVLGGPNLYFYFCLWRGTRMYMHASIILTGLVRIVYECTPLCQYSAYIGVAAGSAFSTGYVRYLFLYSQWKEFA